MLLKLCVLNTCLTLIILTVEVQASNVYITYEKAKDIWDKRKCIFPDSAIYKDSSSFLEQCNATNNHNETLNSVQTVCETFLKLSIQICYATANSPESVTSKLKPEVIRNTLDFTNDDVCQYASNLNFSAASYLNELRDYTQCSQLCLNSNLNTKPICEHLISALCSFFGKNQCQPAKKKDIEPTTAVYLANSTSPAPSTTTEETTKTVLASEKTTTPADIDTEPLTENLPVIDPPTLVEKVILGDDKGKGGNEPTKKEKEVDTTDLPVADEDKPQSESSKKQRVDLNEADEQTGGKDTIESVGQEGAKEGKEQDNKDKEGAKEGKEQDNKDKEEAKEGKEQDNKDKEGANEGKEKDNKGQEQDTDTSKDADGTEYENEADENIDSGIDDKEKIQESKKKVENSYISSQTTADDEESNGSGHFLAYFLTAVVICIAGYIIYHNKQKIMAFVIEGRSSHAGRQRSKGVKYTELKSNVEEVLPSLEKSATAKNFVY